MPEASGAYSVLLTQENSGPCPLVINGVTERVDDTTEEGGADRDTGEWLVCLTVSLSLIRQLLPKTETLTLSVSKLRHMPRTPDENSTTSANPKNKCQCRAPIKDI